MRYAFFDGDKVGNSIRSLLLSDRLEEAESLSKKIKQAILKIERNLTNQHGMRVVIAGGDDVLVEYDPEICNQSTIELVPTVFKEETGISMSFGIGNSIDESLEKLDMAKKTSFSTFEEKNVSREDYAGDSDSESSLFIFSDSPIPDSYINVIAHWNARKNIQDITLIKIEKDIGKKGYAHSYLEGLEDRINLQLSLLSSSKYLRQKRGTRNEWETVEIQLSEAEQKVYEEIKESLSSNSFRLKALTYEELGGFLGNVVEKNRKTAIVSIFDITAVKKEYIVDIYAVLCEKEERNISTFQLILPPSHTEQDLIHNIRWDETYKLVSIANSEYTADKIVALRKRVSNARSYERDNVNLRKESDSIKAQNGCLRSQVAEGFASLWMTVFFFVLVLPTCVSVGILAFRDWDKGFEKYTFIFPVIVFFLISFGLQAIFRMSFSMNPIAIRTALRNWKLAQLNNPQF